MFAAIGDLHLDCHREKIPNLYRLQIKTLQRMLEDIWKKGINSVVLLGDVFDNPHPRIAVVAAFLQLMQRYSDIDFYVLIGNHDWENVGHNALKLISALGEMEMLPNVFVFRDPEIIDIEGISCFMCSHPHVVDMPKDADWAFGHFAWKDALTDNGFKIRDGAAPKGRWILGDFHTHQHGDRFVYAGAITQIKSNEALPKGYLLVSEDSWNFVKFEPSYYWEILSAKKDADLKPILNDERKNIFWSVKTENGYVIPSTIKFDYPNIVFMHPIRKAKDARKSVLLLKDGNDLESGIDPFGKLEGVLKERGLSNKQIKLSVALKNKILREKRKDGAST